MYLFKLNINPHFTYILIIINQYVIFTKIPLSTKSITIDKISSISQYLGLLTKKSSKDGDTLSTKKSSKDGDTLLILYS